MARYAKLTAGGATLLLDGEIGGGLRKRVPQQDKSLVSAKLLWEAPSLVRDLHLDYINAGAQVITTNTYATVKHRMASLLGAGDRWEESMHTAGKLAEEARDVSKRDVLIAGSLPPLNGSYRPDNVRALEWILPTYQEHVGALSEHVDLFLCETMTTAQEAWAAVSAAKASGKPVWVSWTLLDDGSACLRDGHTLQQAWAAVAELRPDGVLVNCCTPETVTLAMPTLASLGCQIYGGYANGFRSIPADWSLQSAGIEALGRREDVTPEAYVAIAQSWVKAGARVVGGCCEIGMAHIAALREGLGLVDSRGDAEGEDEPPAKRVCSG